MPDFPIHSNYFPQPLFIQQTRSAHSMTTQYVVPCDGLMKGHSFMLGCGVGYQRCCITAWCNGTDSFTL